MNRMSIVELVELVKAADPVALAGIPDRKAARIVRGIFTQIGTEVENMVENTDDGILAVSGLGRFNVKNIQREVDGQATVLKRVTFRIYKAASSDAADAEPSESDAESSESE